MSAQSFSEIKKYNPYHGADGRFTTSSGNVTGSAGISGDSGARSTGIGASVKKYGFDTNDGTKCASNVTNPDHFSCGSMGQFNRIEKGEPMSFAQADESRANPGYEEDSGRRCNCQTCVVAYELRRRGYDVQANRRNIYNENSDQKMMARDSAWAWREPTTGNRPTHIQGQNTYDSADSAYSSLGEMLQEGKRYSMEFSWGDGSGAHIIIAEKTRGKTWLFDPQSGRSFAEESEVKQYMGRIAGIGSQPRNPNWNGGAVRLLPVSDMNFDAFAIENVLSKATT